MNRTRILKLLAVAITFLFGIVFVVEEGTVSIGGTFEHPPDVLFLKHRVAEIEGVVALNLQANFRT